MTKALANRVRERRLARGWTQGALAAAAGLSRQSVNAIEAGRAMPAVDVALRIAQAVECRVEELFGPAITARSVAAEPSARARSGRVALAHLAGRWVSHPLEADNLRICADGVAGSVRGRRVAVEMMRSLADARDNVVLMGCAAGLGVLADRLNAQRGAGRFLWFSRSSTAALEELARDRTHVAGVHLVDAKTGAANVPDARRLARGKSLLLITLGRWEAGLLTAAGNPMRLRAVTHLARRGLRLVVREPGSGARRLLERELRAAALPNALAEAPQLKASGHLAVAQTIAIGAADAGIATRDAALAYGLDFVPLAEERYDLAVAPDALSDPRMQRLFDVMASNTFRRELSSLGYDARSSGDRVADVAAI